MNDNSATTANLAVATSHILSPDEFNQYAAAWQAFAGQGGSTPLTDAFYKPDFTRVLALSLPLARLQELVSAVGVRQIKARFLLMPGASRSQFNLALFATDDTGYRLSAYYLPDQYYVTDTLAAKPLEEHKLDEPIPQDLATIWQTNWQGEPEITANMFTTYTAAPAYEPVVLEGYNFEVEDVVSILFGAGPSVNLGLGLHKYLGSAATSDTDWTKTFGLVLQTPATLAARGAGAAQLDFDMAAPSPPNN